MSSKSMVVSALVLACATSLTWAAEQRTGCNPPTAADQAWMDANLVRVTSVLPNRLALQRVAAERQAVQGLMAAPVTTLAAEDGTEIIGVKGAGMIVAAPAAAPNVGAASMAYPRAVDNSTEAWFPPIGGQRGGSCASFSTTYYTMTSQVARLRGWSVKTDNIDAHKFSTRFTYNLINNGVDNGSWITTAYDVMLTMGCATYQTLPYDVDDFLSWPTVAATWRDALNYRMAQSGTVDNIDGEVGRANAKQMLADGYILNFATEVFDWKYVNFKNDPATTSDDVFFAAGVPATRTRIATHSEKIPGSSGSGHAITIVGYNDDIWCDLNNNGVVDAGEKGAFRVANSWGDWEDGGFIWVSYDAAKLVSGVTNGPTNIDPTASRTAIFVYNAFFWISARASYIPTLVAEITATHAQRNQMYLEVGRGDGAVVVPTTTWAPGQLRGSGGALAFDGTKTPVSATFVLDCSDLMNSGTGNRWFATFYDGTIGDAGTFQNARFIDSGAVATTYGTTNPTGGLPKSVDASTVYAYADNATSTNLAPVAKNQNVRTLKGAPYYVVLVATDANGDTLNYSIVANPGHGSLSGSGANRLYTPDANYQGTDFFTFKANDTKVDSNTATVVIQIGTAGSGLMAEFFHVGNNGMIPDLGGRVADLTRVDAQINYAVDADFPSGYVNDFAIRHTGFLNVVTAGSYTLSVNSDDGSKLWLDGALLINNDGTHGMVEKSATLTLSAGYHALRVEFYQGSGGKGLIMKWSGPSIAKAVVPASVLFYPVVANNSAPVAQAQTVNISSDHLVAFTITLVATDVDMDVLSYATTLPLHGSLFGVAPNLGYLPDLGYIGADSFTFKANDGMADSSTVTVSITVANAPPTVARAAAATPNPVTGTTTILSVLGANDGGEANLTYTWASVGTPPAAVTFSSNGKNAGKASTATFTKAGSYSFQCTIKDSGNLTASSNVTVTVNQTATNSMVVTPATATVNLAKTQQYVAATRDQFGNPMPSQLTYAWSLSDTTSGTINSTGLFTANLKVGGPYTVTAIGGGKVGTAAVTVEAVNIPIGPLGFTWCSSEGGSFVLPGASDVAWGANGTFTILSNKTGTIIFNNPAFNGDPLPGQHKNGFFKLLAPTNVPPSVVTTATATPNPVTGTTTALSVLGADSASESGLTYLWATLGTPPAPVTFSVNNSNAAKASTATFTTDGIYSIQCTIKDVGNLTVSTTVTVIVNRTAASVVVTPSEATIKTFATQPFSVSVKDQFGAVLAVQPAIAWSLSATNSGDINSEGLFTANALGGGPYTVTATGGGKTGTAKVTVQNASPTVANAAAATLAMDGKSADLTVLGADNGGESALKYTWSLAASAPAAVTYSVNETNAAKMTTATFVQAGSYIFTVTISDAEGLSTSSTVTVDVSDAAFAASDSGGSDAGGGDSGGGGGGGCGLGSGLAGLAMALMALMRLRLCLRQR